MSAADCRMSLGFRRRSAAPSLLGVVSPALAQPDLFVPFMEPACDVKVVFLINRFLLKSFDYAFRRPIIIVHPCWTVAAHTTVSTNCIVLAFPPLQKFLKIPPPF